MLRACPAGARRTSTVNGARCCCCAERLRPTRGCAGFARAEAASQAEACGQQRWQPAGCRQQRGAAGVAVAHLHPDKRKDGVGRGAAWVGACATRLLHPRKSCAAAVCGWAAAFGGGLTALAAVGLPAARSALCCMGCRAARRPAG
jgi:hypothetical protein